MTPWEEFEQEKDNELHDAFWFELLCTVTGKNIIGKMFLSYPLTQDEEDFYKFVFSECERNFG